MFRTTVRCAKSLVLKSLVLGDYCLGKLAHPLKLRFWGFQDKERDGPAYQRPSMPCHGPLPPWALVLSTADITIPLTKVSVHGLCFSLGFQL